MSIKAIETEYNGYRFRSRLEARWAIFFDVLDIEYHYEFEGFDIDGVYYLPDFFLPNQRFQLIEIKPNIGSLEDCPNNPILDSEPKSKSHQDMVKSLAILVGMPWIEPNPSIGTHRTKPIYTTYWIDPYWDVSYSAHVLWDFPYLWCECPICHKVGLSFEGRAGRLCDCLPSDKIMNNATPRLLDAFKAARQARFEYGPSQRKGRRKCLKSNQGTS